MDALQGNMSDCRLVEVLPGVGAVETAQPNPFDGLGRRHPHVDRAIRLAGIDAVPMGHAATFLAAHEGERFFPVAIGSD